MTTSRKKFPKGTIKPRNQFADEQAEETLESGPRRAKNLTHLAELLGVGRTTVNRWREEKADFPKMKTNGEWDVREVKEFIGLHSLAAGANDSDASLSEKEKLEIRKLQAVCQRLEFQHACERGEYLHKDEVRRQVGEATHTLRRALRSLKGALAPEVAGRSIQECARIIEKQVDKIQAQLHSEPWETIE